MHWQNLLKKAQKIGLSPGNVLSYLSLKAMDAMWGVSTLSFYCKAALLGVRLGKNVRCHGSVGLLRWPSGTITIGNNVSFISSWRRATATTTFAPTRLRVFGTGAITIGDGCELTATSITARSTEISLGKNVLIGPNSVIVDSDFHAPWPPEERSINAGIERDQAVHIDDYVWIGMQCIILKGVHIGKGAIIGAGSVVTHDIAPNTVACGVPARSISDSRPG
ncbi:MAG: acyltransferase [Desulfovibrio sp.]|nr:acyltransferase [Desulfovibrio sp.]